MQSASEACERNSTGAGAVLRTRQLFVRYAGCGLSEVVEVHAGTTVGELRRQLQNGRSHMRLRFSHNGRALHDGMTVDDALIHNLATIHAFVPLCGGGGDGGATGAESRSSYLEMYKDKLDKSEELLAIWTSCRLTMQPLGGDDGKKDVVMCQLGYLYNREAVLECLKRFLVDDIPMPVVAAHISSLKDLTTLKMALVEGSDKDGKGNGSADAGGFQLQTRVRFCCPLTGSELNGKFRFVCLRPSGLVVSERALKTAPSAVAELLEGQPLASQQQVVIYGTEEEQDALRALDAAAKAKKAKKKNKAAAAVAAANGTACTAEANGDSLKRKAEAAPQKERLTGATDHAKAMAVAEAKKYRAGEHTPANADPKLWASLFTSSVVENRKETYGARALSFHR